MNKKSEILQKLNEIPLNDFGVKKTSVLVNELTDIVKWIEDGGDAFGEEINPDAKVKNALTNDDMGQLISYVDDASHAPNFQNAVEKAISLYGSAANCVLYRGISEGEFASIVSITGRNLSKVTMTKARSFTEDRSIAQNFASYGGGNSNADRNMKLDFSNKRIVEVEASSSSKILNYSEFLSAYYCAYYILGIMDKDTLSEYLSMNEKEWIISKHTKFNVVDLKSLHFKI